MFQPKDRSELTPPGSDREAALIAENARLRKALAEAEDRLAAVTEAPLGAADAEALRHSVIATALDCIVTIDEHSRIVEWNPAAERTFGHDRGSVLGRDLSELIIPPELREAHRTGMKRYLATGIGPVIGRRVEIAACRASGARFDVELAISPLTLGGRRHFTAYIRDISDRLAREAALRDSEARLRATCEHALVGIGEVDRDGRFLRVNEQLCVITGYSRKELLARTLFAITHPEDVERDRGLFHRQMDGEIDTYTVEKRYIRKDGQSLWIELLA